MYVSSETGRTYAFKNTVVYPSLVRETVELPGASGLPSLHTSGYTRFVQCVKTH